MDSVDPVLTTLIISVTSSDEFDTDGPKWAAIQLTRKDMLRIVELQAAAKKLGLLSLEDSWDVLWLGSIPHLANTNGLCFPSDSDRADWVEALAEGGEIQSLQDAEFSDFTLSYDKIVIHGSDTIWWECAAKHGSNQFSTMNSISVDYFDGFLN